MYVIFRGIQYISARSERNHCLKKTQQQIFTHLLSSKGRTAENMSLITPTRNITFMDYTGQSVLTNSRPPLPAPSLPSTTFQLQNRSHNFQSVSHVYDIADSDSAVSRVMLEDHCVTQHHHFIFGPTDKFIVRIVSFSPYFSQLLR